MNIRQLTGLVGLATVLAVNGSASAGTLENLERERAIALEILLSPELAGAEREDRMAMTKARLVDLERMVMRGDELKGKNTPSVRTAFENYDQTFLVHSSVENNRSILDHWLEQVGVSTNALMSARFGRR